MPKTARGPATSSSKPTTVSSTASRRSTRLPRASEEERNSREASGDTMGLMGDKSQPKDDDSATSTTDGPNPQPWKHPAELEYIRRADWSQDLIITYLCQKAFTVPAREVNTSTPYTSVTTAYRDEKILVPRGYRLPLMFVAKFQWESLRLVLSASNPALEWEEYRFDIVHLSRLCQHFFKQAWKAARCDEMGKRWRSPMFDRALTRFYRKWMVSREWSVKKFWDEYGEDEYELDVLKFDWARWVLKGHKGFVLTKEEVQNGITADQYKLGLKRKRGGIWVWGTGDPSPEDPNEASTISEEAVEAITNITPSYNTVEVKREQIETNLSTMSNNLSASTVSKISITLPASTVSKIPSEGTSISAVETDDAGGVFSLQTGLNVNGKRPRDVGDATRENDEARPRRRTWNWESKVTARKITAHKSARSGWKPIVARRVALERRFKAQFIADAYDSDSNEGFSDLAGNEGDGGPDMDGDLNAPSQSSISRLVPLTSGPAKRKAKGSGKKAAEKLSTLSSPVKTTTPKEFHVALPIRIPASRAKTAKSSKPPDVAPAVHATTISIRPGLALKSVPEPLKDKSSSSMETPLAPDTLVTSSSRPLPIQVTPSAKHVLPGKVAPCISLLAPSPAMDEVVTRITSEAPIARPASTLPPTPPLSSLFSFSLPSLIPQSPSSTSISSTPPCSSPKQTDDAPSKGPPSEHVIHLPKSPLPSIFGGLYRGHGGDVIIKSRPHVGLTCPSAQGDLSDGVSTVTSSEETQGIGSDVVNDDTGKGGAVVGVRLAIEKVGVRLADDEIRDGELSSVVGLGAEEEAKGSAEGIEMANESRVGERVSLMSAHMDASPGVDWVSSTTDLMKEGGMGGSCEVANGSGVPGVSAKAVDPAMDRGLDTNVSAVNSVVGGVDVVVVSKTKEMEDSPSRKTAASTFGSVHGTTPLSMGGVDVAPSVKWTVSDDIPPVGTAMEEGTTPHVATMQEVGEDDMDVDTERTPDHLGRPDSVETACPDENSGSPMTRDARAKSLHSVQLLRDLLHFLRMPARDRKPGMARNLEEAMENVKSQGLWPSDSYIRDAAVLDGEQSMTVDQRLDILAHASVALANDLYPFRGEELETRINSLDIRLQEQFQMIQNSEDMPFNDYDARSAPIPHRNNGASTSIGLQSEHLERQLEDIGIQTHTESVTSSRSHPPLPNKHRLLSPDATMIDLSTPVTQVAPESSPAPEVATGHRSVAGTVMSMMRNMADLLELSNHGQTEVPASRSVKGKEKAIDFADVDIPEAHWPGKSPVMATLLEEFRHMKEEMRRSQQRSRDELKSIRMAHFTEMETLKDQIRRLEDRGKEEVDKVLHRCQDEMEELKTTIRFREPEGEREKRKAKKNAEESAEPSLELIELRRRVAMLETRARTEVSAADIPRSVSRSSMTNGNISEPAYARNPGSHPLSHLIGNDYEDSPYTPTFKPPRPFARDGSISKPGTPAPSERRSFSIRHPDIMDMDEGIPLPAKSQRKMHMMSFSRPPPG